MMVVLVVHDDCVTACVSHHVHQLYKGPKPPAGSCGGSLERVLQVERSTWAPSQRPGS